MSKPTFQIHGKERRKVKQELAKLKYFTKTFWYYQDIDRVYGYGLPDQECEKILKQANKDIKILEDKLSKKL